MKKNIQPKSFAGGKMYQSNSKQTNFPFNFCSFDNEEGPYDVTLTDTLNYRSGKWSEFYLEDNPKAESCEKTINLGDWNVFVHMPYTNNSIYSYSLQSSGKASSGEKRFKWKKFYCYSFFFKMNYLKKFLKI